ncbi:hypothetical protein ASF57_17815 [Methylobacterium sp. Leaf117]|nr:hypothetical protein ASF57_17815 [Methylobacterium sp. Leaf117]
MTAQMIPVALASIFVAGCLIIQALERWSESVLVSLLCIFAMLLALLLTEVLAGRMPRQYARIPARTVQSSRASYGATSFNENGPPQTPASSASKVLTVFND